MKYKYLPPHSEQIIQISFQWAANRIFNLLYRKNHRYVNNTALVGTMCDPVLFSDDRYCTNTVGVKKNYLLDDQ